MLLPSWGCCLFLMSRLLLNHFITCEDHDRPPCSIVTISLIFNRLMCNSLWWHGSDLVYGACHLKHGHHDMCQSIVVTIFIVIILFSGCSVYLHGCSCLICRCVDMWHAHIPLCSILVVLIRSGVKLHQNVNNWSKITTENTLYTRRYACINVNVCLHVFIYLHTPFLH